MGVDYAKLAFYIAIPLGIGFLGSFITAASIMEWYVTLSKPFFAPPEWIFAPVWTILYIMMGVAAYLASTKKASMTPYWAQLGLNGLWTPLFFGLRSPFLGMVGIALLWISIALTIKSFYHAEKLAAYLLIPYIMWVSFALALNLAILLLNP
ncbi:MAG: tryptophan-rich sensory protein [Candidatus Aenigmarchaeota archaeon]|nr:tryptophan-rich sensory protein [Candidatus Aenigmarchaeota archaeon]